MLSRIVIALPVTIVLAASGTRSQSATPTDSTIVATVEASLRKLTQLHQEVRDIHPLLDRVHPVAVVERGSLFIFDTDSLRKEYKFRRKEPVPFPMEKGIRASFPLASYGGKPTCVVSREVFDSMKGYATIFHEFIHCSQYLTCENQLKQGLQLAQAAARAQNYSWEINHPFPYEDTGFVSDYSRQLQALADHDSGTVLRIMRDLKRRIPQLDYEYMVWVEWKEGLARYIENRIRSRFGIEPNLGGSEQPYSRVTFYYGGEKFIGLLTQDNHELLFDAERLFKRMFEFAGAE